MRLIKIVFVISIAIMIFAALASPCCADDELINGHRTDYCPQITAHHDDHFPGCDEEWDLDNLICDPNNLPSVSGNYFLKGVEICV